MGGGYLKYCDLFYAGKIIRLSPHKNSFVFGGPFFVVVREEFKKSKDILSNKISNNAKFSKRRDSPFLTESLSISEENISWNSVALSSEQFEVVYDIEGLSLEGNRWRETDKSLLFCDEGGIHKIPKNYALEILKEDIKKVVFSCPEFASQKREQIQSLQTRVSLLEEMIEELRRKKRELKYAPGGGEGALEAERHFQSLC